MKLGHLSSWRMEKGSQRSKARGRKWNVLAQLGREEVNKFKQYLGGRSIRTWWLNEWTKEKKEDGHPGFGHGQDLAGGAVQWARGRRKGKGSGESLCMYRIYVQVEPHKIEIRIIIQCSCSHPSWYIKITGNFKLPTSRTDPKTIKICEGEIQSWLICLSSPCDSVDLIDHVVFTAELKGSHFLFSWFLHR